jgi:hypothetical protein
MVPSWFPTASCMTVPDLSSMCHSAAVAANACAGATMAAAATTASQITIHFVGNLCTTPP